MRPFRYERPTDLSRAVDLLANAPQAAFLGGGTNLVDLMKLDVARPDLLVDVRGVISRAVEELPDGGVRVGAGVSNSDLVLDPLIRRRYPVVAQAVLTGASTQLRNLATVGGNLLQRTRCLYFQDVTMPCNKREPDSGCSAIEGHSRDLAILGSSPECIATHPSDLAVALAAMDATVRTVGPAGERTIPLVELHRLPGAEPWADNVLTHGELITAVDLPPLAFATRSHYRKIRDRASYAFALVSVAAAIELTDGLVRDARIALGGVAHKPWRARRAEELLRGGPPTEERLRRAAAAELADARPRPDNAFKVPLARNAIVRTVRDLAAGDAGAGTVAGDSP